VQGLGSRDLLGLGLARDRAVPASLDLLESVAGTGGLHRPLDERGSPQYTASMPARITPDLAVQTERHERAIASLLEAVEVLRQADTRSGGANRGYQLSLTEKTVLDTYLAWCQHNPRSAPNNDDFQTALRTKTGTARHPAGLRRTLSAALAKTSAEVAGLIGDHAEWKTESRAAARGWPAPQKLIQSL